MAEKLRTILSELATDVKATNIDDRISFRYLHSKFTSKLQYFVRLEAKTREIFKNTPLWQPINCLNLIEVPTNTCGYIDKCNSLSRSEIKIPAVYDTNYGPTIKVLTIDGFNEFKLIAPHEYKDYINRRFAPVNKVYWIENGYLYFPNVTIEAVKPLLIPKNPIEVDKINGSADQCTSPLEAYINYPDYLIMLAKKEVFNEIMGRTRVVEDEKGDNNTNIKN